MRWEDYYQQKAKDSFATYFRLVLFEFIINGREKEFSDMDGQSFVKHKLAADTMDYYIHAYWQEETGEEIKGVIIKDIISSMDSWYLKSENFRVIAKSIFSYVTSNGDVILEQLIKRGLLEEVSPTDVRIKWNAVLKEDDIKEIAKGDFDKIWAILRQSQLDKRKSENLTSFFNAYRKRFAVIFPKEEFEKLYKVHECAYCGISEEDIMQLAKTDRIFKKSERGWHLEIDRKDSNKEYMPGNCVRCCYWCNNAKTDEFTEDEFKPIAEKIREVWVKRGIERLRKSVE